MPTWREQLRPLITTTLAAHRGETEAEKRQALRDAWDAAGYGPRQYFVYKIWCDEISVQLGKRVKRANTKAERVYVPDERQEGLF